MYTFFPLAFATKFLKISLGLLSMAQPARQQWPPIKVATERKPN